MVTVVCTRWLDAFPASYIRVLRNAVRANLEMDHRFICLTDNPGGLDTDIEAMLMPEMNIPLQYKKSGCWPKLSIFAPNLLPPDQPTLYLDLDVLIKGNITPFFEQIRSRPGLHALREWNPSLWSLAPLSIRPDRGVQGSILGFIPQDSHDIYHRFLADRTIPERYGLDQDYMTDTVKKRHYWPFEWTASFKWHCTKYYPLNKLLPGINEPTNAKIVVFHGRPRPIDVVPLGNYRWGTKRRFGYGPVPWVRDYWLRFDEQWVEQSNGDRTHLANTARG